MPQRAWSAKRERQYEHVKEGYEERGTPEDLRRRSRRGRSTRSGPARERPRRRAVRRCAISLRAGAGGLRSHSGQAGRTYRQLYNEAREAGIRGRSKMNKRELERAAHGR